MEANMESTKKDYAYKVKLVTDIHDMGVQYTDSKRPIRKVLCNGKKGYFKTNLGIRLKDYKATKQSAAHFGEFIAYKIAEKISLPVCEVELLKRNLTLKYSKTGKSVEVPGCISYIDLKQGESFIPAATILSWYKMEHKREFEAIVNEAGNLQVGDYRLDPNNEINNNNIELILPAFESYAREQWHMSEEEVNQIRQNIINMIVFDCKFANRDRHDENYGLSTTADGKVKFYPIFDNEYILGLAEFEEDILKYSGPRLQEHIDTDLYSVMGVTSKPTKLGYQAMLSALFLNNPEETKKAIDLVMNIQEKDVSNIMDECEGLSDIHKAYALRIFRSRQRGFETLIEEYVDEKGQMREQKLPGKKPMELGRSRGGSSGRKSPSIREFGE